MSLGALVFGFVQGVTYDYDAHLSLSQTTENNRHMIRTYRLGIMLMPDYS
jgi:hypothetical protein